MLMSPREFASWTCRAGILLSAGLVMLALGTVLLPVGVFTGCMALLLGSCITTFDDWRFERDRWRQTALFFLIGSAGYFGFLFARVQGLLQPQGGFEAMVACDIALATALAWKQLRYLLTITRLNWMISQLHPAETETSSLPWLYTLAAQPGAHSISRSI